jgi:hypothetical protein
MSFTTIMRSQLFVYPISGNIYKFFLTGSFPTGE